MPPPSGAPKRADPHVLKKKKSFSIYIEINQNHSWFHWLEIRMCWIIRIFRTSALSVMWFLPIEFRHEWSSQSTSIQTDFKVNYFYDHLAFSSSFDLSFLLCHICFARPLCWVAKMSRLQISNCWFELGNRFQSETPDQLNRSAHCGSYFLPNKILHPTSFEQNIQLAINFIEHKLN